MGRVVGFSGADVGSVAGRNLDFAGENDGRHVFGFMECQIGQRKFGVAQATDVVAVLGKLFFVEERLQQQLNAIAPGVLERGKRQDRRALVIFFDLDGVADRSGARNA